jgi:hypothetical protein
MSKLYVTEYSTPASAYGHGAQAPQEPRIRTQVLDFTSGQSISSLPFQDETRIVRVNCDAACSFDIGDVGSGNATTSDARMSLGSTEYFGVRKGQQIFVIQNT